MEDTVPGRAGLFQQGDGPGNRADMMLVACQHLFGAGPPVAAVFREGLGATLQDQRRTGPLPAGVGATTRRALGPAHENMGLRLPVSHVQGQDLAFQVGGPVLDDPARDLGRRQVPGELQRGGRDGAGDGKGLRGARPRLQVGLRGAVPPQPLREALPAARRAGPEHGAHPELAADRLDEQPGPAICQRLTVVFM